MIQIHFKKTLMVIIFITC